MTELDEKVTGVLSGMPVLPAAVGRDVLARLARIERAIAEDMIDEGTILLQFRDLEDSVVVLAMTVKPHFAFLDISTSEDAIALSHGYSFCIGEQGVALAVDREHQLTQVDHSALCSAWLDTERMLGMIEDAKALMRTHPIFRDI